jgi:hypothetical protein
MTLPTLRPDALSTALWLAYRDHPIVPLPGDVGDASTDAEVIRAWFASSPSMDYGVRCDDLVVIEAEPWSGGSRRAWAELRGNHADPHSWRTYAGDGWQLYFSREGEVEAKSLAHGFEIKTGAGAFVIGPGSKGTRWAHQCSPVEVDLLPAPSWLFVERCRECGRPIK